MKTTIVLKEQAEYRIIKVSPQKDLSANIAAKKAEPLK